MLGAEKRYLRYNSSAISYLGNKGLSAASYFIIGDVDPLALIVGRFDKKESKMQKGLKVSDIPMLDDRIRAA